MTIKNAQAWATKILNKITTASLDAEVFLSLVLKKCQGGVLRVILRLLLTCYCKSRIRYRS